MIERYVVGEHAPQTVDDGRESDGLGRVAVAVHLVAGALEVEGGRAGVVRVHVDAQVERRSVVHALDGLEVSATVGARHHIEHELAHALLGRVLNVAHVGEHDAQRVLVDELRDEVDALLVGRYLRLQVRQVVAEVACAATVRILARRLQCLHNLCTFIKTTLEETGNVEFC